VDAWYGASSPGVVETTTTKHRELDSANPAVHSRIQVHNIIGLLGDILFYLAREPFALSHKLHNLFLIRAGMRFAQVFIIS
jgi:hypothetical protein